MIPTAILTADMHLRNTTPRNRIDDYFLAQEKKVQFIYNLQEKYTKEGEGLSYIPVFDAGDLFDKWNSTPFLEAWAMNNLPFNFYTVPGNHELPSKDVNNVIRSSLYVLDTATMAKILYENENGARFTTDKEGLVVVHGFPYGAKIENKHRDKKAKYVVALIHSMVIDTPLSYKDSSAIFGETLLDYMSNFDLIVTGHNHKSFVIEKDGRFLVNPGSMMRMSKSQINDTPRIYLWYADEKKIESVYLPIEKNVFSVKKIERENKKQIQIESFVDSLNETYEIKLSYKKNMENYLMNNPIEDPIKDIIWKCFI